MAADDHFFFIKPKWEGQKANAEDLKLGFPNLWVTVIMDIIELYQVKVSYKYNLPYGQYHLFLGASCHMRGRTDSFTIGIHLALQKQA